MVSVWVVDNQGSHKSKIPVHLGELNNEQLSQVILQCERIIKEAALRKKVDEKKDQETTCR